MGVAVVYNGQGFSVLVGMLGVKVQVHRNIQAVGGWPKYSAEFLTL
jgi:hypothetical protein